MLIGLDFDLAAFMLMGLYFSGFSVLIDGFYFLFFKYSCYLYNLKKFDKSKYPVSVIRGWLN